MVISGTLETEKEVAGKAIIDVCTKMTGSDAVALGSYRGFALTVSYDTPSNEYRMTMKGTLSYTVVLVPQIILLITENYPYDEMTATNEFYASKVYGILEDEETKLWHFSLLTLFNMFDEEKRREPLPFRRRREI